TSRVTNPHPAMVAGMARWTPSTHRSPEPRSTIMQESNDRAEARTSKWVPRTPGGNPSGRFENLRARWRDSVWQPVIIKSLSVCAGMVGLAAIGIFSTLDAPDPQDQLSSGDESSPIATIEE